jgi:hypothetical protein
MIHAKKIALADDDDDAKALVEAEKPLPDPPAPSCSYTRMDDEMHNILQNKKLSEFDKWVLYEQVLHRYLKKLEIHKNKRLDSVKRTRTVQPDDGGKEEREVAITNKDTSDMTAGSSSVKARLLYGFLEKASCLDWDAEGRVSIMGTATGASVKDYIEASMKRKPAATPDGWNLYVTALKSLKIPPGYVTNQELREALKQQTPASPLQFNICGPSPEELDKHVRSGKTHRWTPY